MIRKNVNIHTKFIHVFNSFNTVLATLDRIRRRIEKASNYSLHVTFFVLFLLQATHVRDNPYIYFSNDI
jgi:hypothetical protein